jgi:hypothetical protein
MTKAASAAFVIVSAGFPMIGNGYAAPSRFGPKNLTRRRATAVIAVSPKHCYLAPHGKAFQRSSL